MNTINKKVIWVVIALFAIVIIVGIGCIIAELTSGDHGHDDAEMVWEMNMIEVKPGGDIGETVPVTFKGSHVNKEGDTEVLAADFQFPKDYRYSIVDDGHGHGLEISRTSANSYPDYFVGYFFAYDNDEKKDCFMRVALDEDKEIMILFLGDGHFLVGATNDAVGYASIIERFQKFYDSYAE